VDAVILSPETNRGPFDLWTIPHFVAGMFAAKAGIPLAGALWGALAVEAIEIGLSARVPDLARETRSNQLGDMAAFLGGYTIGGR
jgi:hypothetical protein